MSVYLEVMLSSFSGHFFENIITLKLSDFPVWVREAVKLQTGRLSLTQDDEETHN